MKKKFIVLVALYAVVCPIHAQTLYVPSGTSGISSSSSPGKVGIGVVAPEGKLHVNGVGYFGNENESGAHRISVGGSGGDYGSIGYGFKYTGTSGGHTYAVSDKASQLRFHDGGFIFYSAELGTAGTPISFANRATILRNGNFGIGVSNPEAKLHVNGDVIMDGNSPLIFTGIGNTELNRYLSLINSTGYNSASGLKAGGVLVSDSYSYANPGKNDLVVKGNIGIGTGSAVAPERLHIAGEGRINLRVGRWASLGETYSGLATIIGTNVKASNAAVHKMEFIESTEDGGKAIKMQYNEGISFHTYLGNVTGGAEFTGHERMRIDNSGNVGIGTRSPDSRLTVKGIIHTEEVRVDLNVPAPDYVFEKDYALMPLAQIEAFVNEHKHLPEVPSAKEFEADGLRVKEMNLLLLKKIEELTLHLIRQEKEIETLKQKVQ